MKVWQWESFENFLKELNKLEYLILRNYETLMEDMALGEDIDILCADTKSLVNGIHALPIVSGDNVSNYYIMIGDKKVFIDIREVGDGYYDEKWERNMLNTRVKTMQYFTLDDENYKYSILYHVMLHKNKVSKKYDKELEKLFGVESGDNQKRDRLLCAYMYQNNYSITIPEDNEVTFNQENCRRLCETMKNMDI